MALAIFDLDETLISADSDHAWGEYVVANNLVDKQSHQAKNEQFYQEYKQGVLDIEAYMRFSCAVLAAHSTDLLYQHRQQFIDQQIKPLLLPKALAKIAAHKEQGDLIIVVTATIDFITQPIVELMGIKNLIAPEPEMLNGRYTGKLSGIPSYGIGKVIRLKEWVKAHNQDMTNSYFYSDSANDIPLLEAVEHPVAVDPDPRLEHFAKQHNWPIISFRD
ncbi:MAG: HAD-IB family hydrolase [Pseudomonadales bacterium]|nr:HAD-IB family hydrolase [Pseudomonadales bacterium]